jgi:glutamate racemase
VEKLMRRGIKALVVACNTATAAAIHALRQTYPDLIIIGIEPAIKLAADRYPGGTVGVLATPVTLQEEKFRQLAQRCEAHCRIVTLPAPGLADLVEAGKANSAESLALLEPLLRPWANKLDALVLGCTHYPFAAPAIGRILGSETELLDGGDGTARETCRRLREAELLAQPLQEGCVILESSGNAEHFKSLAQKLLDR